MNRDDKKAPLYPRAPIGMIGALFFSLLIAGGLCYWTLKTLPYAQRFYLWPYVKNTYLPQLPGMPSFKKRAPRYAKGTIPANILVTRDGQPISLNDSPVLIKQSVVARTVYLKYIKQAIYEDRQPWHLFTPALCGSGLCFVVLMFFGIRSDARYSAKVKKGVVVIGPDVITPAEFRKLHKGDGMGFYISNGQTLRQKLMRDERSKYMFLDQEHEAAHRITMGDSGSGKTSDFIQQLDQARERGYGGIIYDAHMQFAPRYYDPSKGDVILNPFDARCPIYDPRNEIDFSNRNLANAVAKSQGNSLSPDQEGSDPKFFKQASRDLWAYLIVEFQPSPQEMASWMVNEIEIMKRVFGSALESQVPRNAAPQRAAVMSEFSKIAPILQMLPTEMDTDSVWSIRDYMEHRKGFIFLTADPDTRASLSPFYSLILDQAISRIISMGERHDLPPVVFSMDECPTLGILPSLTMLLAEGRKPRAMAHLGIQGRKQFEKLYGSAAEVLFSNPYTSVIMTTKDGDAAQWVEKKIGLVKRSRVKESKPAHIMSGGKGHSYQENETTEPLVMATEIQRLEPLEAFVNYGSEVVKIKLVHPKKYFKKFGLGMQAAKFIPRITGPVIQKVVSAEAERVVSKMAQDWENRTPVPQAEVMPPPPPPVMDQSSLPFRVED